MKIEDSFVISLTSVPDRFDSSLVHVLENLNTKCFNIPIVVSIPHEYRKNWKYDYSNLDKIKAIPGVNVYHPQVDYGPSTKLLGGIEWVRIHKPLVRGIITLDDDILFENISQQILHLIKLHLQKPNTVITHHGLKLMHPPYITNNGLQGVKEQFCDAVAGFLGVLYPSEFFRNDTVFKLIETLNPLFYSEDDAYFGGVASILDLKIWSAKQPQRWVSLSKQSAVEQELEGNRIERESLLYNELIHKKIIIPS